MSNGLADRFKRGDESVMDMMKRIKEEITTEATANQWENKLEEFGVIFSLSRGNHVEKCIQILLSIGLQKASLSVVTLFSSLI